MAALLDGGCALQNLHKGVLRDQELYLLKRAQQKLLRDQQSTLNSTDIK